MPVTSISSWSPFVRLSARFAEARTGGALDRGNHEFVEVKAVAQHLQEPQFLLLHMQVRRGHFDGQRE